MIPGDDEHMKMISDTMEESEVLWNTVCNAVEDKRVEMLIQAMTEQFGLVMEGESNADVIMGLVGFISNQVIFLSRDGAMSVEAAMVLLQMGMQKGVQAHMVLREKSGAS